MQPVEKRRLGVIAAATLVAMLAFQTPTAELRIQLHDVADVTPRKVEAAVDLGIAAVSVLVTWTAKAAR